MSNPIALGIHPLMYLNSAGAVSGAPDEMHMLYTVHCREHGDVTRAESGGLINDARIQQAHLYAQRHLAKHLIALGEEIAKFAR